MPEPIEIAFYQFGIRLFQSSALHRRCTAQSYSDPSVPLSGADCVVMLRHSLRALDSAFVQLARIAKLDDVRVEMGKALIGESLRLWNDWSQLSTVQLHDEDFDNEPFLENAERIDDFAQQLSGVQRDAKCEQWYCLGKIICDGYWVAPWLRPQPSGSKSERHRERPSAEKRTPKWEWVSEAEVRELCQELGTDDDELLPSITDKREFAEKVPFDPRRDETWWRVELGLAAMKGRYAEAFGPTAGDTESGDVPTPPANGESAADSRLRAGGYLGLWLDDNRRTITREGFEGQVVDLSHSRLDWAIVKSLTKGRDTWTSRDVVAGQWEEHGVARKPAKGTVDDRISDLNRKLGDLGIRIVSRRKGGMRLEDMAPPPQDSPESCGV